MTCTFTSSIQLIHLLISISVFTFQIGYNGDNGQSNLKSASVSEPGPVEVIDVQVQLRGKLKSILS